MQDKAFTAGVVPGGLTTSKEIKILICYLLWATKEPVSPSLIVLALSEEGLVNYFECADALSDLLEAENIIISDESCVLSEAGRDIAENLSSAIPLTVRERAVRLIKEYMVVQKNRNQHKTEIIQTEDGYLVRCRLSDGSLDLFSLELYAPNRRYAQNVQRNFIINGEEFIRTTLEKLTSDPDK